jgi:hypothetical protein
MITSRFNLWPYAIIATFVLFASYIGFMVQQAMRTSVDLVSADYYQQEIAYQKRIESVARTAALPAPVQVRYDGEAQRLTLDFKLPFTPAENAPQQLNTAKLQPGYWRLRIDFVAGGQQYFVDQELSI